MEKNILICLGIIFLYSMSLCSAILVESDYVTIYPGEDGSVKISVENNENFDIEDVSVGLLLNELPFSAVGSSEKDLDDLDNGDDDSATFTLKASTGIVPGDYNIPYVVKYTNADEDNVSLTKTGSFGLRVSAKTDIDFSVETKNPVIGQKGEVSLKIINKGLGEIKFISVEIEPKGFELVSSDKVYVGTIGSDDSDTATFDVLFKSKTSTLSATITYKDFDNNEKTQSVSLPVKVYTQEEAYQIGLMKKSNTWIYALVILFLILVWIIYRKIKKAKKNRVNGGK